MKKLSLLILGGGMAAAIVWGFVAYWGAFRSARLVMSTPAEDITRILNTTGMPLELDPGFGIEIFARDLGAPRVLVQDPTGTILTSVPSQGKILAVPDYNGDGVADDTVVLARGLARPHGLALKCATNAAGKTESCRLYVAESTQVSVFDYDHVDKELRRKRTIVGLPQGGSHTTRTILFGAPPNGNRLLISVGSSCNVCAEKDSRRGAISSLEIDPETGRAAEGARLEPFAAGLRNAVFLENHPTTGMVWASEMGRDYLGDHLPPDEINVIEEGRHYGWPYCYGARVHDPNFDPKRTKEGFCGETKGSYLDIPAHSAPLGIAFIPESWPEDYRHDLLVAYHGSWNRSEPTGYSVVRYRLDEQGNIEDPEPDEFVSGWLRRPDGERYEILGRPAGLLLGSGGEMYISDDQVGVIYRIRYTAEGVSRLVGH